MSNSLDSYRDGVISRLLILEETIEDNANRWQGMILDLVQWVRDGKNLPSQDE